MTREDEFRKYCSDNGFPLGACSSIASLQAETAVEAIKWADKTMIEKACKWLDKYASDYVFSVYDDDDYCSVSMDLVDDFRKAMED